MPLPLSLATYFTLWWVTLFAILPFGVKSQAETPGIDQPRGIDKGAPVAPMMVKKVIATTLVSCVIFAALDAYVYWAG